MPVGLEAPAVIAAFDLAAVEMADRQGHAAMRADVAQREDGAVAVPPEHDRLAEHRAGEQLSPPQPPARRRVIPGLAQRRRAVLHAVLPRRHQGDIPRGEARRNAAAPRQGYPPAAAAAIFARDRSCPDLRPSPSPCSASSAIPVPDRTIRAAPSWRWAI